MDNFYYQVHPDIPFIDLRMYQQTRLIASSNNRVYLYCSSMQQIAVKEIVVPLEYEKTLVEKLKEQYKMQSDQKEYIIQIYGMAQLSSTRLSGKIQMTIYICMEYMPYCLQDYIEYNRQGTPNSTSFQNLLTQGLQTHAYLQSLQICHGDIKPQNILINDLVNPTVFKTCDFDNMVVLTASKLQPCIFATQMYHAPEIQQAIKQGQDSFHYNPFKAQVYSFGLCLLQMHPFNELQITGQAFSNIEQAFGNNMARILQNMLDQSNFQRPDFQELFQLISTCGINSSYQQESTNDILKSQNSNLIRNTPDMYDFFRRESKYPYQMQDSVDYSSEQLLINNFSEPSEQIVETLNSQVVKKPRKCCSITFLKIPVIVTLTILILISLFLVIYFVVY